MLLQSVQTLLTLTNYQEPLGASIKPKMHKQLVSSPNHGTKCAGTIPKHKQRHASKHYDSSQSPGCSM